MQQEDELRFMQERFGVDSFTCEFNITGKLWTSRVTSHVPLREVADLITPEAVRTPCTSSTARCAGRHRAAAHRRVGPEPARRRRRLDRPWRRSRSSRRRWKRCARRPGRSGPWSPDTVFIAARRGDFDAVVSMYHDQGQIAMKLMGFESGVTLHGGLPVPVATSASGSAFDIAGKGIARVDGLQQAFDLCVRSKLLMPHSAPLTNTRCSCSAIKAPKLSGVSSSSSKNVLGRLPGKLRWPPASACRPSAPALARARWPAAPDGGRANRGAPSSPR
jgi:4-hydroxythreonine-4-phosphate dehydrogenase